MSDKTIDEMRKNAKQAYIITFFLILVLIIILYIMKQYIFCFIAILYLGSYVRSSIKEDAFK